MSFREQSAWITLVSVLIVGAHYVWLVAANDELRAGYGLLHVGLISVTAIVVLQIVLNVIATLLNLEGARTPRDEREKLIQSRSHTIGYYTLMISVVVQLVQIHLRDAHAADLMNIAVGGVVVAVTAVAIAQIIMFRRGA